MRCTLSIWGFLLVLGAACSVPDGDGCILDSDCPIGRYCQAGQCAFDCTFDADCPDGFRCTSHGSCERGCVKTNNGVEVCDGLDNDCDDAIDEDFADLGQACSNGGCPEGLWICSGDGSGLVCDGPQPAIDDGLCNGLDDDCDGATDEDAVERPCALQAGVCAGAAETCLGALGWSVCDYGPDYIEGLDDACDRLDSDCDGDTDEDAAVVLAPESGPLANDGLDNNCNGLVDEAGGVLVPVPNRPGVWIAAFEVVVSQNPDCSGARYGESSDDYPVEWPTEATESMDLYACSLPGVVPSGYLSWYRADRACRAQGMRLCNSLEYQFGCDNGQGNLYPYGVIFVPGMCNDFLEGPGHALPTGSLSECTADGSTFDMSGNLSEWLQHWDPDGECADCALVAGAGFDCEVCAYGQACNPCVYDQDPDNRNRVERKYDCGTEAHRRYEIQLRNQAKAHFGTRCCYDGP